MWRNEATWCAGLNYVSLPELNFCSAEYTTPGPLKHQISSTLSFDDKYLLFLAPKILKSTFFEDESLLFLPLKSINILFFEKPTSTFFVSKGCGRAVLDRPWGLGHRCERIIIFLAGNQLYEL